VPEKQLDAVSALLSDHRRSIFMIGGRLTDAFAMFFHHYLCQIRPNVYKVSSFHEEWPEFLLRMNRKDVVVMFDCRRYQPDLLMFAERSARDRGCQIVLLTDKWLSPIAKHSVHILPASVEVDTPWDTGTSVLFLVEALINRVAEADWSKTRKRIKSWEAFRISLQAARPDEG
jgi:DNA-binding MurR/RpiR family transcriptional regulator